MENIKGKVQNSLNTVAETGNIIVSKTLALTKSNIGKKIFDNIIWVVVLVGVLILIYFSYLLTATFDIDNTINLMKQEYNITKVNVSSPSASGEEEKFDEIKLDKHNLCDVFICSSAKSYLSGRQIFDYVSKQVFFETIKQGARYVELDLFENSQGNIVVSNGIFEGNWRLTLNEIYFEDFCRDIPMRVFNKQYADNFNDPFIIFLGLHLKKDKMNLVAKIIEQFMGKHLISSKYSVKGGNNVLDLKLEELLQKIIIVTDGKIANTDLLEYVHLRVGDKVRKLSISELRVQNKDELRDFNKNHITIVTPDPNINSVNYNSELALDCGCQIISMNFQSVGDQMKIYLSKFYEKSFILKPYEFTKYSDIPQKGYDNNRIAYYNNYEILQNKNTSGIIYNTTPPQNPKNFSKINDYNNDKDSIFFKNRIGAVNIEKDDGCCKLFIEDQDIDEKFPKTELDKSITEMLHKIHQLGEEPSDFAMELDSTTDTERITDILRLFTMDESSPSASDEDESGNVPGFKEIKYDILRAQLKKILQEKREELFKQGLQDPCFNKDENKCSSNPMCYYETLAPAGSLTPGDKCESKLSSIPYPKLCLPKYVAPNRNMCLSSQKDKGLIDSKGMRQILHEKMTHPGFSGKWNSFLGQIEIPEDFNNQCEFTFTTNFDGKIFTLFLVNYDGNYFNIDKTGEDNFIGVDNYYKLRAKGTFVDPMLRNVEQENDMPEMPYHGYVELKMSNFEDENKEGKILRECLNNKFIGIYRYSDKVFGDSNTIMKKYTAMINKFYENNYNDKGMVLGLNKSLLGNQQSPNIYCYKILSNQCLDGSLGPAISFENEELPEEIYEPVEETLSNEKLVEMTKEIGLDFKKEEFEKNPKLRNRIIGFVSEKKPEMISEHKEEVKKEKEAEKKNIIEANKKMVEEKKKEVVKEADLFIYHNSVISSDTQKKPGDAFIISGPNSEDFCIQRKMEDDNILKCNNGKCNVSDVFIGPCKNSPVQNNLCSNVDAMHNIQFVINGEEGDKRTQQIRFLNNGEPSNPVDACLSYNAKGDVVYANCRLEKNKDTSIKNEWKVYRKEGNDKYKITSSDGKCLTRVPHKNVSKENLEQELYKKEPIIGFLYASTKLEDCKEDNKVNQEFNIKFGGDLENCESSIPKFVNKPPPVQGRSIMPGAYGEKPFLLRDEDKEL